jgi:putative membrane protein
MHIATKILVSLIALEHFYFLYLEMFSWTSAKTRTKFGMTEEFAQQSKKLAANQGLYNGFLAAGLLWSLFAPATLCLPLARFFVGCVLVAGVYVGITTKRTILYLQGLPALIALLLLMLFPST